MQVHIEFCDMKSCHDVQARRIVSRWNCPRHAGHNQQTETETSLPPCLELTLSLHCHGCCVGSADALRLCLCYRCCNNQSSSVWRTQPARPRPPSRLQRSLWKCSVTPVAGAEWSAAPRWHTISNASFPLLSASLARLRGNITQMNGGWMDGWMDDGWILLFHLIQHRFIY